MCGFFLLSIVDIEIAWPEAVSGYFDIVTIGHRNERKKSGYDRNNFCTQISSRMQTMMKQMNKANVKSLRMPLIRILLRDSKHIVTPNEVAHEIPQPINRIAQTF